eukprot:CAMPEP_0116827736 /NCGR_PEP_ID=MMETSP0418-20121206/3270_1 /TAXON_ID=1158023 /ORGANISM="Astrosyne radiata, Strain 13vi08-1A" /LENGTH=53 /DNA_ID=CAMNT_0004456555 /DNA_START=324 /DNA_END=485 /DNA_ORIENTATION=-
MTRMECLEARPPFFYAAGDALGAVLASSHPQGAAMAGMIGQNCGSMYPSRPEA